MADVIPYTTHIDLLYTNINRIGESVNKIESTVLKENEELKEKLRLMEIELEEAKESSTHWEQKYTDLVHQNNLNEATIRSFKENCRYAINYFDNIVGRCILNYNESNANTDFELRDLSNDNMETGRSILISRQTRQIGAFFGSMWISKKLIAKRTIKRLRKMYKKFVLNGG
jgi:hypothetical protein